MSPSQTLTKVELTSLKKVGSGKVRDLFEVDDKTLLFVTTDRMSAYDVGMANGLPDKGVLLTQLSAHWFGVLSELVPGLRHHLLSTAVPAGVTAAEAAQLRHRCMQVRRLKVFPIEAIVRGYLAGSAWAEYRERGSVHGIRLPAGLRQCEAIPGGAALYTPSTKAPAGRHDENIHPDQARLIDGVGERYAPRIADLAVRVFEAASAYALERGIIIADTKFEFALDEDADEIVLVDEVLTPDSSRMWDRDSYEPGRDQDSFDKQLLRNWLTAEGLKGKDHVTMSDEIVQATAQRYRDVFRTLTGNTLEES